MGDHAGGGVGCSLMRGYIYNVGDGRDTNGGWECSMYLLNCGLVCQTTAVWRVRFGIQELD